MSAPAARPLDRGMKVFGVLFLTLSAATPASSVFVIVPGVVQASGTGALIAMAAAGVVALCMALTYSELGSRFPSAGGEYAIVGEVLGPTAAFAMLGVNLLNLVLACAALSLGVADYLKALAPTLDPAATALAVVATATGLGVLNIRASAAVTGAFLVIELVALLVLTALGLGHPVRELAPLIAHPVSGPALAPAGLGALASGVVVGLFAYDGYGSAVYLSEEVIDVRRRLVRAVLWALAATAVFEMAALAAVLVGSPDLKALFAAGDTMIADFAAQRGGPLLGRALSAGVALAILNAVIALVLMTARQLYATARDGVWPAAANRALVRVHARWGSPWAATLLAGAVAAGLCLVPLSLLLTLSGAGVTLIYAGLCVAGLSHGRGGRRAAAPGWKMPLWPGPPILALLMLAVVAATSLKDSAVSYAVSFAAAGLAAAYYILVLRRSGGWRLGGPALPDA